MLHRILCILPFFEIIDKLIDVFPTFGFLAQNDVNFTGYMSGIVIKGLLTNLTFIARGFSNRNSWFLLIIILFDCLVQLFHILFPLIVRLLNVILQISSDHKGGSKMFFIIVVDSEPFLELGSRIFLLWIQKVFNFATYIIFFWHELCDGGFHVAISMRLSQHEGVVVFAKRYFKGKMNSENKWIWYLGFYFLLLGALDSFYFFVPFWQPRFDIYLQIKFKVPPKLKIKNM